MKVIGLTGGIGSGKSAFCHLMAEHDVAFIDTDQIARQVVAPNSFGLEQIVENFSAGVLNSDGTLNRAALRELIFADANNPEPRERLEAILHPLIQAETRLQIQQWQENPEYQQPIVIVAIPLLVEGILKKGQAPDYIDEIWVLDCDESTQIARASQRDNSNEEQIRNIMKNQATREQRKKYADKIISNSGTIEALKSQARELIKLYQ